MSRSIIGKIAITYDGSTVVSGAGFVEIEATPTLTDSDCIAAFIRNVLPFYFKTLYRDNINVISSMDTVRWTTGYIDPDRPIAQKNTGITTDIGNLTMIDSQLALTLLDIDDTGADRAIDDIAQSFAQKNVTFEIYALNIDDIQSLHNDFNLIEETEDIYHLLKPFITNSLETLDQRGYSKASDNGSSITLQGKSVRYRLNPF